jgi:hypothetical protein
MDDGWRKSKNSSFPNDALEMGIAVHVAIDSVLVDMVKTSQNSMDSPGGRTRFAINRRTIMTVPFVPYSVNNMGPLAFINVEIVSTVIFIIRIKIFSILGV